MQEIKDKQIVKKTYFLIEEISPPKSRHPFLPHLCKLHYQPESRIIDPCGLIITDANNIGWHIAILFSVQALYRTSKIMFVLVHKTSDFPELY